MTEAQTTAERIDTLIGENSIPMPNGWAQTSPDATQYVVETIAAEIDGLRRELAEARESLNAWRTMFPVNTPAEVAMKLIRGG